MNHLRRLPWLMGGLVGAAIAAPLLLYVPRPVTSADFAAWAQGLGTVLAVSIGVWAGLAPTRARAREQARERIDFLLDLTDVLEIGAPAVNRVDAALSTRSYKATIVALKGLEASTFQQGLAELLEAPRSIWPDGAARSHARLLNRLLLGLRAEDQRLDMSSDAVQQVWIGQIRDQLQLIDAAVISLSTIVGRPTPPRSARNVPIAGRHRQPRG